MRAVIHKQTVKHCAGKARSRTGDFWVLTIDAVPAYRCATRSELIALLLLLLQ